MTKAILSYPEAKEFNPIMRFAYKKFGILGIAFVKSVVLVSVGSALYKGMLNLYELLYINFIFLLFIAFMARELKQLKT